MKKIVAAILLVVLAYSSDIDVSDLSLKQSNEFFEYLNAVTKGSQKFIFKGDDDSIYFTVRGGNYYFVFPFQESSAGRVSKETFKISRQRIEKYDGLCHSRTWGAMCEEGKISKATEAEVRDIFEKIKKARKISPDYLSDKINREIQKMI